MKTKTQQAKELFESGDLKGALRLVKGFRIGLTPSQRSALSVGYECLVHPNFYVQLGKCLETEILKARVVLDEFFQEHGCIASKQ